VLAIWRPPDEVVVLQTEVVGTQEMGEEMAWIVVAMTLSILGPQIITLRMEAIAMGMSVTGQAVEVEGTSSEVSMAVVDMPVVVEVRIKIPILQDHHISRDHLPISMAVLEAMATEGVPMELQTRTPDTMPLLDIIHTTVVIDLVTVLNKGRIRTETAMGTIHTAVMGHMAAPVQVVDTVDSLEVPISHPGVHTIAPHEAEEEFGELFV